MKPKSAFSVKGKTIIFVFIYILTVVIFSLGSYTNTFNKLIAVIVLFFSVVLVYKCANNNLIFVMSLMIAYSNYSVVVGIYLDPELRPIYLYPQITDVHVYGIGIVMLMLFVMTLLFYIPKNNKRDEIFSLGFVKKENYNFLLYFIAASSFVFILLVGYQRSQGSRGKSSTLYEYASILIIIMFYYCGNKKWQKYFCALLCCVYVLTSFLNGTRVEALTCLIILFLCFVRKPLPKTFILAGMLSGIILMNLIGTLRGNLSSIVTNFGSIFQELFRNKLVFDTCTHAYFPMLCMIEQFKTFSISDSIHYFSRFLYTILLGQSRVKDGDLIQIVRIRYYHNYGGISLGFFYVWFSYAGSFVYAMFVNMYLKIISNSQRGESGFKGAISLYAVASVPRWYLYGPWALTRGVLICGIAFYLFTVMDRLTKKRGYFCSSSSLSKSTETRNLKNEAD